MTITTSWDLDSEPIDSIDACLDIDHGLRQQLLRSSSLSLVSNAFLSKASIGREDVQRDWGRYLILEEVSGRFDALDLLLCREELTMQEPSWSDEIILRGTFTPTGDDQLILDDVLLVEPHPAPRTTEISKPSAPADRTKIVVDGAKNPGRHQYPGFMTASERMRAEEQNHHPKRPRGHGPGLSKSVVLAQRRPTSLNNHEPPKAPPPDEFQIPPELDGLNLSPNLVEMILSEIMDRDPHVQWTDIAGLEFAKKCIREIVVWPMLRPDIFTGLRGPPKGLLLFGPPGTGKTMIGRAIASECGAKFFSISASSLTSKWHGESEKLVRTLFAVARAYQPAVIFVDEIDSLLSQRSDSDFEGSRRLKTEFLVQLDGASTSKDDRVLLIGATNRPQELDEAARRRMVKRLYIPLPDVVARRVLINHLLSSVRHDMDDDNERTNDLLCRTKGYSGADLTALCTEAAYGPIRDLPSITDITPDQVRPISFDDFFSALDAIRASVSSADLDQFHDWNDQFGSFRIDPRMT